MKLSPPDEFITKITDKVYAKEYVRGKTPIKPIPSIFEGDIEDFKPNNFPFIAKPNNKSNRSRFVSNGEDWVRFKKMYNKEKDKKYGFAKGEWNYWGIPLKLIIEPVLTNFQEYKYHVFHNRVKVIEVMNPKNINEFKFEPPSANGKSFFNEIGEKLECRLAGTPLGGDIPENALELIPYVETLSEGLEYIRIDLIDADSVYFGEFSLFCHGGYGRWEGFDLDSYMGGFF